jgi:hypothetical protein
MKHPDIMFTVKPLKFNAVLVQTKDHKILAETLLRFQEHYESPEFKNKIFTVGQIKHWYSQKYGADSYTNDWTGFNFPSRILIPFKQGLFDPLTKYEKKFLNLFRYRHDNFYIIGANDESTIRHELSHALFAYSVQYKAQINQICKTYAKQLNPLKKILLDKGYDQDVLNDELQAYITDDSEFIYSYLDKSIVDKFTKTYAQYL